jgi:hypothetical protein
MADFGFGEAAIEFFEVRVFLRLGEELVEMDAIYLIAVVAAVPCEVVAGCGRGRGCHHESVQGRAASELRGKTSEVPEPGSRQAMFAGSFEDGVEIAGGRMATFFRLHNGVGDGIKFGSGRDQRHLQPAIGAGANALEAVEALEMRLRNVPGEAPGVGPRSREDVRSTTTPTTAWTRECQLVAVEPGRAKRRGARTAKRHLAGAEV